MIYFSTRENKQRSKNYKFLKHNTRCIDKHNHKHIHIIAQFEEEIPVKTRVEVSSLQIFTKIMVTLVFIKGKLEEEGYRGKVLYFKSISFKEQQSKNCSAILILLHFQSI